MERRAIQKILWCTLSDRRKHDRCSDERTFTWHCTDFWNTCTSEIRSQGTSRNRMSILLAALLVYMGGGQLWRFIRYSREFPSVLPLPLRTGGLGWSDAGRCLCYTFGLQAVKLLLASSTEEEAFRRRKSRTHPGYLPGSRQQVLVDSPSGAQQLDGRRAALSSGIAVLGTKITEESRRGKAWVTWQLLVREYQGILTASPKLHTTKAEDRSLRETRMLLSSRVLQLHPMLPLLRDISSFKMKLIFTVFHYLSLS